MKRIVVVIGVLIILLASAFFVINRGLNKPDDILIRELIARGEQAVEAKSLRQAMSCISPDYKCRTGRNYDGLRLIIYHAFQQDAHYDAQVDAPNIQINGDTASATTKVALYSASTADREQLFSKDIELKLKKESTRRYWIFPIKEWKITAVGGLEFVAQEEGM